MRWKDHKRLWLTTESYITQAKELGIIDLTKSMYKVDFSVRNDEVLQVRGELCLDRLDMIGLFALKKGHKELADEITHFISLVSKGGLPSRK